MISYYSVGKEIYCQPYENDKNGTSSNVKHEWKLKLINYKNWNSYFNSCTRYFHWKNNNNQNQSTRRDAICLIFFMGTCYTYLTFK